MKTKQDNNVTNSTYAVYTENQNKLSYLIGPSVVYEEKNTG